MSKIFAALLSILIFSIPKSVLAESLPYLITPEIPNTGIDQKGLTFFTKNLKINYQSGNIILSSKEDGTNFTRVDDALEIIVTRPNGTVSKFNHSYEVNCSFVDILSPKDLTNLFLPGENQVTVRLFDVCGTFISSSPLYLVNTNAPAPTPFLDLPWDYEGKGLNFNEAAHSMTSYFDHSYPLLSSGLSEPNLSLNQITTFENEDSTTKNYSSHDGYDYAKVAKANNGDPVLAAAAGIATYINSCTACGNAILIDHGNGYQTRYYHLQKDGLITSTPLEQVSVNAGQQIGKVGATGNVFPSGEAGAHIHFMVVKDKDGDSNFENNLPDGVVDPFGWQSQDSDPWENFSFFYTGQNRAGLKSFYLWKKKLDNLDATLTTNGGVFNVGVYQFNFSPSSANQNLTLNLHSAPNVLISQSLTSIGSTIVATALTSLGIPVTLFQNLYTLTADFAGFDLSRFIPETISIYSSSDGINWVQEPTIVDLTNHTATTQVNHMSYFGLFGERRDITAPSTIALLDGLKGQNNWFRSDVTLVFDAQDNDLGVDYTLFKPEGGDWETYNNPLIFTNEGHHKIEFYSVDNDENIEDVKSVEFNIDKTLPETSINADPSILWPPNGEKVSVTITGNSLDNHIYSSKIFVEDEYDKIEPVISGFNQTIQLEAKREGSDLDGRKYIIKVVTEDLAGNQTTKEVEILVPHDQSGN